MEGSDSDDGGWVLKEMTKKCRIEGAGDLGADFTLLTDLTTVCLILSKRQDLRNA